MPAAEVSFLKAPPRVADAWASILGDDPDTDLAVLRNGENLLLRGLGRCRFARANETWAFDGGNSWTVMSHTADQTFSFQGEGFAGFAWSTVNPQLRTYPFWVAVTQLFNHQTHHRGQVTTLLMQQGIDPGVTDLIWLPELLPKAP
jgi:hypothetical protein